ncbi:carbohydrate kinase family protein, partial [Candidatus Daviesbacteria bacterium]|nr:carbohydrate kinase family protein [Candidatus Daviesbacteria bacterium]
KGERTILVHHQPWEFNLPDLDKTRWVYLTSMSPSYTDSKVLDQLVNYVERSGAKLAYQPGTFQLKMGSKKNAKILVLSQILIVNLEEAKDFLGINNGENVSLKKLLLGLVNLGPKMVVVTDGNNGSYGFDGESFYQIKVFPADVLEMTGAGDAYATGLVAGLIYGRDLPEAMRWGAANGASVIEQIGSQAGLLTYNKMQEKLKENSKIVAKGF